MLMFGAVSYKENEELVNMIEDIVCSILPFLYINSNL